MTTQVQIDEIDVKILHELVKDARAKLKDMARMCNLSPTAIFNRISRLRAEGVIVGAAQFVNMSKMGYLYPASIGIYLKPGQRNEVEKILRERTNLVFLNESAGSNSFAIFLVAKSMQEIDDMKQVIRKRTGIREVNVNVWNTPNFNFENIDLQPTKG